MAQLSIRSIHVEGRRDDVACDMIVTDDVIPKLYYGHQNARGVLMSRFFPAFKNHPSRGPTRIKSTRGADTRMIDSF